MRLAFPAVYRLPALLGILAAVTSTAQSDFALRDGDTVVFYGDSITDQRLYTTFAETFVLTRFPDRQIRFVHSGWGGDRVSGGGGGTIDERLRRDVVAHRPSVVTIMLGMNDGRYRAFDPEIFQAYANGYESLVRTLKAALPGVRLTLIQPSPYDDVTRPPTFTGGYNGVLTRYGQFLAELAKREGAQVADLNTSVVAMLRKANEVDPPGAQKLIPDRVHPGPGGHLAMAAALLRDWHAPATVTTVEIDAAGPRVSRAERASVTDLRGSPTLTWTQLDEALPFPLDLKDPTVALTVRASDFAESLNRQTLRVTGLTAPSYRLDIEDVRVGSFTREELAAGVNLAMLDTPMRRQAAEVHALTLKRTGLRNTRWRAVQVPFEKERMDRLPPALAALDELESLVLEQQRGAARPLACEYVLTPE